MYGNDPNAAPLPGDDEEPDRMSRHRSLVSGDLGGEESVGRKPRTEIRSETRPEVRPAPEGKNDKAIRRSSVSMVGNVRTSGHPPLNIGASAAQHGSHIFHNMIHSTPIGEVRQALNKNVSGPSNPPRRARAPESRGRAALARLRLYRFSPRHAGRGGVLAALCVCLSRVIRASSAPSVTHLRARARLVRRSVSSSWRTTR